MKAVAIRQTGPDHHVIKLVVDVKAAKRPESRRIRDRSRAKLTHFDKVQQGLFRIAERIDPGGALGEGD